MQNDQDFQKYVCQQLQELSDRHTEMDERITTHIALTKEMADIVMMGKSMFMMANYIGKGLRVAAYFVTSVGIFWAAIHHYFRGFDK